MQISAWRLCPGWAAGTILTAVLSAGTALAVPRAVGSTVDALTSGERAGGVLVPLALILLAASLTSVAGAVCGGVFTARVTQRLRARAIASVTDRGAAGLPTGDVATRLLVDAQQPAAALGITLSILLSVVTLAFALGAIATTEWWVLIGLLVGVVAFVGMVRRFVTDTTDLFTAYRAGQAEIAERALDAQRGAASIQAHGTWCREVSRILAPLSQVRAAGRSLWMCQGVLAWRATIFTPAVVLVTLAISGISLADGRISTGDVAALVGYASLGVSALDGIEAAAGLSVVRVGVRRIAEITRSQPGSHHRYRTLGRGPVELTLDSVTSNDQAGRILDEVTIRIPPGGCVTAVGPLECGTALAQIATGVITPTAGTVVLDGVPLAHLAPDAHVVALASARPPLLGDTVKDFLALGLMGTDPAEIRAAAEKARIHHVIEALPHGYETRLDDLELSGGELQRLGIAQALLHGSGLLALEGATSSLDPATELEVMRALVGTRRQRTILIASPRPALAAIADETIDLGHTGARAKAMALTGGPR